MAGGRTKINGGRAEETRVAATTELFDWPPFSWPYQRWHLTRTDLPTLVIEPIIYLKVRPFKCVPKVLIFTPPRKLLDSARGVNWRPQAIKKRKKNLGGAGVP